MQTPPNPFLYLLTGRLKSPILVFSMVPSDVKDQKQLEITDMEHYLRPGICVTCGADILPSGDGEGFRDMLWHYSIFRKRYTRCRGHPNLKVWDWRAVGRSSEMRWMSSGKQQSMGVKNLEPEFLDSKPIPLLINFVKLGKLPLLLLQTF